MTTTLKPDNCMTNMTLLQYDIDIMTSGMRHHDIDILKGFSMTKTTDF